MNKIVFVFLLLGLILMDSYVYREFQSSRTPSSAKVGKMYQYKGWLAVPPVRFVATLIMKKKLSEYVDKLPMNEDVKKRIKDQIHSKVLSKQIVPFLFALKELYSVDKSLPPMDFDKYIVKSYPTGEKVPGLKHDLFTYTEKEKKEKKAGGLDGTIAMVLTFYDAIVVQNKDFRLGTYPTITDEMRNRVRTLVLATLDLKLKGMNPEGGTFKLVSEIRNDKHQVGGIVESAIDFFYRYSSELSQMFSKRYAEKKALEKWLLSELDKSGQGDLWDFVESSLSPKPYGVHVIVDGLQGHLVHDLAEGAPDHVFLSKVNEENEHHKDFKPRVKVDYHDKKIHSEFINFLIQNPSFDDESYLPFFKNLYKKYPSGIAKSGVTTTPTTSGRNLPMIAAGAPAAGEGGTGIPNFSFLDREKENAFYFLGNQSFLLSRYVKSSGMRSLFDRLPNMYGINCNSVYMSGADLTYDGYLSVTAGEKSRDFGDRICIAEMKKRAENQLLYNKYLKELLTYKGNTDLFQGSAETSPRFDVEHLISKIANLSNEIMPQYFLYYSPWPDHFAHYKGPFSDEIISPTGELNRLDYWLTQLTEAYKRAGIYDQTLWGMTGDHGLSPIYYSLNPEDVFTQMQKEGIPLKMTQISAEIDIPIIVNFNNRLNMRGYDVIVGATAGGSFVIDLFLDQEKNWKKQPLYSDLLHHKFQSGDEVDVIDRLVKGLGNSLEYMTVRMEESDIHKTHMRLITTVDGRRVDARIKRQGDRIFYSPDYDILGVRTLSIYEAIPEDLTLYKDLLLKCVDEAKEDNVDSWCTEEEWRTLTSFTIKPASVSQLSHLHDSDKSGTINLFPAKMVAFHTKKFGKHAGEDFHEKDAFVALWGTPVKGEEKLLSELNGSVPVTLYEYLSGEKTTKGEEGWGFSSLMGKLKISR